jgi:hypothetical protein
MLGTFFVTNKTFQNAWVVLPIIMLTTMGLGILLPHVLFWFTKQQIKSEDCDAHSNTNADAGDDINDYFYGDHYDSISSSDDDEIISYM